MKKTEKINYYRSLPYTREIVKGEDGYFVKIKELRGCISVGDTVEDAWAMIDDALESWLEVAIEDGMEIPLPESIAEENYSGKFALRMPKTLHADISKQAENEGVSINQYIVAILAAGNQNFKFNKSDRICPETTGRVTFDQKFKCPTPKPQKNLVRFPEALGA
jgi:antitoxin HicB